MTTNEFAGALNGLINSGMKSGLAAAQMVGILECTKLDLVRALQDMPKKVPAIIKANHLPPGPRLG